MKAYILILTAIVFIGNITGQRTSEDLVSLSKEEGSLIRKSESRVILCYGSSNNEAHQAAINQLIDGLYVSTTENLHVVIGGIPGSFGEATGGVVQVTEQNICHGKMNATQAVTKQEIKRIPSLTGEPDIVQALMATGCPKIENKVPAEADESTEDFSTEGSQGPFTGLEGHNFIEDPAIIYPNPVRDVMNIKSTDPITVIEILGINGQVEKELDPRSSMDVSDLAAGTYFVRIHFENIKEVQIEKILIVK